MHQNVEPAEIVANLCHCAVDLPRVAHIECEGPCATLRQGRSHLLCRAPVHICHSNRRTQIGKLTADSTADPTSPPVTSATRPEKSIAANLAIATRPFLCLRRSAPPIADINRRVLHKLCFQSLPDHRFVVFFLGQILVDPPQHCQAAQAGQCHLKDREQVLVRNA